MTQYDFFKFGSHIEFWILLYIFDISQTKETYNSLLRHKSVNLSDASFIRKSVKMFKFLLIYYFSSQAAGT